MPRTLRTKNGKRKHPEFGRARGISKAKSKIKRRVRRIQDRAMRSEDPIIEKGDKIINIWWTMW